MVCGLWFEITLCGRWALGSWCGADHACPILEMCRGPVGTTSPLPPPTLIVIYMGRNSVEEDIMYNFHFERYVCPQYPFVQSKFLISNVSTYFPIYSPINTNTIHNTTNKTPCGAKPVRAPARGTEICHIWVGILRKHLSLL